MARKPQEIRDGHARRTQVAKEVRDLEKEVDSKKKFQTIIKLCKEFTSVTKFLQSHGEPVDDGPKRYNVKYWEEQFNEFNKKQKSLEESKFPKKVETPTVATNNSLYYIMLCWTNKNDYFVCGSVIDRIKTYFEKLKLEFFDTQTTSFPDRTEHCSTFKFRGSEDVYNTIISSAEYIIDISASTIIENCNVGVFGQKIE
jgi:hypothetical protein